MRIQASMFGIILISALVLAQSNVELSEIETNPIPTMVNFDGYQRNADQTQQEQTHFDFADSFTHSNTETIQNVENNKSIEDPNNFILDNQNVSTLNSEITSMSTNGNQIQGSNDIPQLDMIDTEGTQVLSQQDLSNISETQQNAENQDCIESHLNYANPKEILSKDFNKHSNFDHDIKSIQIPKGYSVRLYNKEDFTGEKIILKESQECLNKPLALTQLYERQSHQFTILAQNLNLRGI